MPGFFLFSPERMKAIRERRGMSREQLAVDADLSYAMIAALEGGLRNPSRETLICLAAALDVLPRELVDEDPVFEPVAP